MEYALIKNGRVNDVIVAGADFVESIRSLWDHIEPVADGAGVGWGWNGAFVAPPPPTPEEAQSLIQLQIYAMEREKMLPRIVREMTIAQLEQWATQQGYPLDQFRLVNKGYRMIKEFDEQIAALRAQL